jgi:site-specific DNA-methyltransferase (adenine-specific)
MVRDLAGTVEAERAKMGIFVTLEDPTTGMRTAALRAGYYETEYGKYEKIQILTVEDLFDGKKPHMPWVDPSVFKKAKRENIEKQGEMEL